MNTMRAIEFRPDRTAAVVRRPVPQPGPGEVLVRVLSAGICGSDFTALAGRHPFRIAPLISGHEGGGRVEAWGDGVTDWAVGERVVFEPQRSCHDCALCQEGLGYLCPNKVMMGVAEWPGTLAEFAVAPAAALHRVAPEVPDWLLALGEPMAVAVHSVQQAPDLAGHRVLVLGGGSIGAFIVHRAAAAGAAEIVVSEPRDHNRELCLAFGADAAIIPAELPEEFGAGTWFDTVFVAAAVPGIVDTALAAVRPRGTVVQVGLFGSPETVRIPRLQMAERRLVGSNVYTPSNVDEANAAIATDPGTIARVVSHRGSLEDAVGFLNARMAGVADETIKYIVEP